MSGDWTEAEIAAHLDGALDREGDARIRDAIATDPEARAAAERLRRLNRLLGAAYPLPGPAIPDHIAAALATEPGRVVGLPFRRSFQWLQLAVAASVALAVGIGTGFLLGDSQPRPSGGMLADAGPALEGALETLASGTLSDAGVRPLSTFRDAEGRPCREFETAGALSARIGIACRQPRSGWEILAIVAVPEPASGADGFAPASGPEDQALDLSLEAIGAGVTFSPDKESALIRSGWRSE
jgi:anti-sigma factor RsiW